jgi:Zn-dependent protease
MSAVLPASRSRTRGVVLARYPIPITVGAGSLLPLTTLAAVFVLFGSTPHPLLSLGAAVVGGLGGGLSLIAHELGHVGAARRLKGVRPVHVSLRWFGAVTRFEGAYCSGGDQARVAIAGPAASLAFAVVMVAAALLPVVPRPLALGLFGVGLLNAAVAFVSLLPVHPLDGHKLLVGLLWRHSGSEPTARTILARAGKTLLALEAVGYGVLILREPLPGTCALAVRATLALQKHLTASSARSRRQVQPTSG